VPDTLALGVHTRCQFFKADFCKPVRSQSACNRSCTAQRQHQCVTYSAMLGTAVCDIKHPLGSCSFDDLICK